MAAYAHQEMMRANLKKHLRKEGLKVVQVVVGRHAHDDEEEAGEERLKFASCFKPKLLALSWGFRRGSRTERIPTDSKIAK